MPACLRVSLARAVGFDKSVAVLAGDDRETRRLLSRSVSPVLKIELSNRMPAPRHLTRIWNAAAERTARHLISVILCVSASLWFSFGSGVFHGQENRRGTRHREPQRSKAASRCACRRTPRILNVEIQSELQRMRSHSQRSDLTIPLVCNPPLNDLMAKDIALEQECVIVLKCLQ